MISFIRSLHHLINLIAEAALEIFSPNHDDYPPIDDQAANEDAFNQGEPNQQFKSEYNDENQLPTESI